MDEEEIPPPLSPEELRAKIRSGKLRIVMAEPLEDSQELLVVFRALDKIVYPEGGQKLEDHAFVSDGSTLSDFITGFWPVPERAEAFRQLSEELGFEVKPWDYIKDVVTRLRERDTNQ